MVLVLSIVVGVLIAVGLFRLFFKDATDFLECVRYYFQPDILSVFRGEWLEDWWGSTKLGVWLAVSVGMGFVAHYKFDQFWGSGSNDADVVMARSPELGEEDEEPVPTQPPKATATTVATAQTSDLPTPAKQYGVKVGDTVQISAINPAIALRRATIASMDADQITVKNGLDDFKIRWQDVTKLKASAATSK